MATELVDHAAAAASRLLSPLERRWAHVQGVVRQAEEIAGTVDPADRELLVAAAWLHDIGYAPNLVRTGFHPIDGAEYLENEGYPAELVALVAHHSCARIEADVRGLSEQLSRWPCEYGPVVDALVYADVTTGPQGQQVSFDARVEEILARYGPGTEVHEAVTRARPALAAHVVRVEFRELIAEAGRYIKAGDSAGANAEIAKAEGLVRGLADIQGVVLPLISPRERPEVRCDAATCLLGFGHSDLGLLVLDYLAAEGGSLASLQAASVARYWRRRNSDSSSG